MPEIGQENRTEKDLEKDGVQLRPTPAGRPEAHRTGRESRAAGRGPDREP
jgi:hypothetical protein